MNSFERRAALHRLSRCEVALTPVFANVAVSDQVKDAVLSIEGATDKVLEDKLLPAAQSIVLPKSPDLWLLGDPAKPEECGRFRKSFGPTTATDGPWKLLVTTGEKAVYKLFNPKLDPEKRPILRRACPI